MYHSDRPSCKVHAPVFGTASGTPILESEIMLFDEPTSLDPEIIEKALDALPEPDLDTLTLCPYTDLYKCTDRPVCRSVFV